jgi:hypothetical protein
MLVVEGNSRASERLHEPGPIPHEVADGGFNGAGPNGIIHAEINQGLDHRVHGGSTRRKQEATRCWLRLSDRCQLDENSGLDWCSYLCEPSPVAALGNCVVAQ